MRFFSKFKAAFYKRIDRIGGWGGRGGGGEVGGGRRGGGKRIRGDAVFSFVAADKAHKGNCGLEGREGRGKQRNKVASILRWQAN